MKKAIIHIFFIIIIALSVFLNGTVIAQTPNKIRRCPALQNLPELSQAERIVVMPQFMIPGYWTIKLSRLLGIWNPFVIKSSIRSSILGFFNLLHDDKERACHLANELRKQVTSTLGKYGGLYFLQYFGDPTKSISLVLD